MCVSHTLISCYLDRHACCMIKSSKSNAVIEIATLPLRSFRIVTDGITLMIIMMKVFAIKHIFLFALMDLIGSRTGISTCCLGNSLITQSALVIFLLIYSFWWKQVDNKIENLWITSFLMVVFYFNCVRFLPITLVRLTCHTDGCYAIFKIIIIPTVGVNSDILKPASQKFTSLTVGKLFRYYSIGPLAPSTSHSNSPCPLIYIVQPPSCWPSSWSCTLYYGVCQGSLRSDHISTASDLPLNDLQQHVLWNSYVSTHWAYVWCNHAPATIFCSNCFQNARMHFSRCVFMRVHDSQAY